MSPPWDDLKIVLAAARTGSLVRAATVLQMDQSTVSRRLTGFETALGLVLFKRSRNGLQLTEAGQTLLGYAETIEDSVNSFMEVAAARRDQDPSGLVRLLGNGWMLNLLSEHVLPGFLEHYPKVQLRLLPHVPRLPVRSDATLSLWFEAHPENGEISHPLGDVPFALYAAKDKDPDRLPWVSFYDEDAPDRAPLRYWNRHRAPSDILRATVGDASLTLSLLRGGVGKGLLPTCLGATDDRLRQVEGDKTRLSRTLHVHVHPDVMKIPAIEAMLDCLQVNFATAFLP